MNDDPAPTRFGLLTTIALIVPATLTVLGLWWVIARIIAWLTGFDDFSLGNGG